jgi:hypothetical protein
MGSTRGDVFAGPLALCHKVFQSMRRHPSTGGWTEGAGEGGEVCDLAGFPETGTRHHVLAPPFC